MFGTQYRKTRNLHNTQNATFEGVGAFDIPATFPCELSADEIEHSEWISFNYAISEKHPEEKIVHFFLDDYQFERLWHDPNRYIEILKRFKAITSPDFSLYTDFPIAVQIYNHYRKQWLAAFYQMQGIEVIPTICWSDPASYDFCFDGNPQKSIVAISDVGCYSGEAEKLLMQGFSEMIENLHPKTVFIYTQHSIKRFTDRFKCDIRRIGNKNIERLGGRKKMIRYDLQFFGGRGSASGKGGNGKGKGKGKGKGGKNTRLSMSDIKRAYERGKAKGEEAGEVR